MHGVHCERLFGSHFHPSLLTVVDEEVHLFYWVLCKTFECTTLDINLAVVGYKFSETMTIVFIEISVSGSSVYIVSSLYVTFSPLRV